ncbi:unnamed protein product [Orchesella dallaii]|uniref:Peptidase metallopeptidase domain-containing protein n=1 Tax=Orchesella dallaii TaxID=48710 RepID=A0ABP1PRX0_9HEXA
MQKFGALPQTGKLDSETLALLTKPRCGIPDVIKMERGSTRRKRFIIGSNGWNKRRITYRVENWAPKLSESSVISEVRQAFNVWSDYARLRFIDLQRENRDDVDISISFGSGHHGDSYPFDGSGGVLAHAFFPYNHDSLGGDIHFDLDENWSSRLLNDSSNGTPVSFLSVAVHEIGHSLGLSHSPSPDSVMFPYYQNFDQGNVRLGYDDIMAMYQLYIQRTIQDYPDEKAHSDSTTESTSTPITSTSRYSTHESDSPTTSTTASYSSSSTTSKTSAYTFRPTMNDDNNRLPDICKDGFDTISFIRNEIFVFKNDYMWRYQKRGVTGSAYPVKTSRLFPMLEGVGQIDAAFENTDGTIIFFSGKHYWSFDGQENLKSRPITNFGLPGSLHKIDAAFIWGKNNKLYIFSGNVFWRYNTTSKSIDEGYPKGIERWKGLPDTGIDSVLKGSDGITYFFKTDEFWRFDDTLVHTESGFPLQTSRFWFGC